MKALVCGAGGFIGSHLVIQLKHGVWCVRGVDLKYPGCGERAAQDYSQDDQRQPELVQGVVDQRFDEIYQLAADAGGTGFLFTGEDDAIRQELGWASGKSLGWEVDGPYPWISTHVAARHSPGRTVTARN